MTYRKNTYYTQELDSDTLNSMITVSYSRESDLTQSVLRWAVSEGSIKTRYELDIAYETVSDLNDWPEGEGYGSSDRASDLRSIKEAMERSRKYIKAEKELWMINKLDKEPMVGTVLAYMDMTDKLRAGLTEGGQ
jgi:hypothetical protein